MSGIVALMLAHRSHLTANEVRTMLAHSSRRIESPSGEIEAVDACMALADSAKGLACDPNTRAAAAVGPPTRRH